MSAPNPINKNNLLQLMNVTVDVCQLLKQKKRNPLFGKQLEKFEKATSTKLVCPFLEVKLKFNLDFYVTKNPIFQKIYEVRGLEFVGKFASKVVPKGSKFKFMVSTFAVLEKISKKYLKLWSFNFVGQFN